MPLNRPREADSAVAVDAVDRRAVGRIAGQVSQRWRRQIGAVAAGHAAKRLGFGRDVSVGSGDKRRLEVNAGGGQTNRLTSSVRCFRGPLASRHNWPGAAPSSASTLARCAERSEDAATQPQMIFHARGISQLSNGIS